MLCNCIFHYKATNFSFFFLNTLMSMKIIYNNKNRIVKSIVLKTFKDTWYDKIYVVQLHIPLLSDTF